jgi:hypothetical protein
MKLLFGERFGKNPIAEGIDTPLETAVVAIPVDVIGRDGSFSQGYT